MNSAAGNQSDWTVAAIGRLFGWPRAVTAIAGGSIVGKLWCGDGEPRCYRDRVTMFRHRRLLAGMHAASTVAVSCADITGTSASVSIPTERRDFGQPRCSHSFREPSARATGVRPGRKNGPEENSHKYLNFAVVPGRNVV